MSLCLLLPNIIYRYKEEEEEKKKVITKITRTNKIINQTACGFVGDNLFRTKMMPVETSFSDRQN